MRIERAILLWIIVFFSSSMKAQNIALHKSYTLSTLPNYKYSAPSNDKLSLTDGVYTKLHFWTQRTTVGWQGRQVTITIDLSSVQPIEAVTFNTARKTNVRANFPANIYVFFSQDSVNYTYEGDAADTPDNLPGGYLVKKFILSGLSGRARYVSLRIIPTGKLIFCDEIEVLKGHNAPELNTRPIIKNLDVAVDSLKEQDFNRKNLMLSIENLGITGRNEKDNVDYADLTAKLNNKNISKNEIETISKKLRLDHALALHNEFKSRLIFEKYSPWDSLNEFHEPKANSSFLQYQFSIFVGDVQYGAFVVSNSDSKEQSIQFSISKPDSIINNIELFNVPFVPTSNFRKVLDPLVPVKNRIVISPGVSALFIFKVSGKKQGQSHSYIRMTFGNITESVNIKTTVNKMAKLSEDILNANVWAYLRYPMIKDRQTEAANDLISHHVNTVVLPPALLTNFEKVDYSLIATYLNNFKTIGNILLYTNYPVEGIRNGYKGGHFLSPEWKSKFIVWYNNLVELVRKNGFPNTQIYLYPYDEIRSVDIQDFRNLITWSKKAIPGIKYYATLTSKAAIDSVLGLVDIAQIPADLILFRQLPPHSCEIWIYGGSSPSRSLSPYGFYRLIGWKAFVNDIKGVGFWDYADEGNSKQLNRVSDAMINLSASYSVIYDGPGKEIISSRRWEAFRLGIEDYAILKMYARKSGIEKAKYLASLVLSTPFDYNKADSIRNIMLHVLVNHS